MARNRKLLMRGPSPRPSRHGLTRHRGFSEAQSTSVEFGGRLKEAGPGPSLGSVADAYDNTPWRRASSPP